MKYPLLIAFSFLAWGCNKDKVDRTIPPLLQFVLLDKEGNNLLVSTSTPLKMSSLNRSGQRFYLEGDCATGECMMIRAAYRSATYTPKYSFYYSTLGAPLASSNGSKLWYLELGGKTDTLYFDVEKTQTKAMVFNGEPAHIDPNQLPIYVFRRKH